MTQYGRLGNLITIAQEVDVDTLLELLAEWEKILIHDGDARWQTAKDAHFLLRRLLLDEVARKEAKEHRSTLQGDLY